MSARKHAINHGARALTASTSTHLAWTALCNPNLSAKPESTVSICQTARTVRRPTTRFSGSLLPQRAKDAHLPSHSTVQCGTMSALHLRSQASWSLNQWRDLEGKEQDDLQDGAYGEKPRVQGGAWLNTGKWGGRGVVPLP